VADPSFNGDPHSDRNENWSPEGRENYQQKEKKIGDMLRFEELVVLSGELEAFSRVWKYFLEKNMRFLV
jgi:hypothetical protein